MNTPFSHVRFSLCISVFVLGIFLYMPHAIAAQCTPPDCIGCGTQQASNACTGANGGGGGAGGGGNTTGPLSRPNSPLILLQSPNGVSSLNPSSGILIFFDYFNLMWPWVLGIAAGIGVLQALMGASDIMTSGSDSGKRENGKNKILWALAGLLMVGFAGTILRFLNPNFFV